MKRRFSDDEARSTTVDLSFFIFNSASAPFAHQLYRRLAVPGLLPFFVNNISLLRKKKKKKKKKKPERHFNSWSDERPKVFVLGMTESAKRFKHLR